MSRGQTITAAVMLTAGVTLILWTVLGDHGMRWGVIGSVLVGFAGVEAYVSLLDDEQRRPIRGRLYVLTPLLSGGIFAAAVIQEKPHPIPGTIVARDSSAIGLYDNAALTWSWDGLTRTEGGRTSTIGEEGAFFDPPAVATHEVVIDASGPDVRAFDPATGVELWARKVEHFDAFRLFGDLLVYDGDGFTAALEVATGQDHWRVRGDPTLAHGGLYLTGGEAWWDLNAFSGLNGLIEQDHYVGVIDGYRFSEIQVVEVDTGKVVRTDPLTSFQDPYALAGEFLYTDDGRSATAIPLRRESPARTVSMRPHDNSQDRDEPTRLFESKYPGFVGAVPDGWVFPDDAAPWVERGTHSSPAFPVNRGDTPGVWFAPKPEVVRIEDGYDELLAHSYDGDTYAQLVTDHDAVGDSFNRLDLVRAGEVTSFTASEHVDDSDEAVSLRGGLVCVAYACWSVDDLLG